MSTEISKLRSLILDKLNNSSDLEETGIHEDKSPESRLIDVEDKDHGCLLKIASDGLGLNHKIALEAYLLEGLSEKGFDKVTVYYKRLKKVPGLTAGAGGPAPIQGAKTGPFGFPIKKKAIPGVGRVIAVSSGKGGVGKSTVSSNLAVALAKRGKSVGLLDADIYGPSAPLMLGLKGPMPVSGGNRIQPLENYGVKCVSFGFMTDEANPVIWRGPMVAKALKQLFYETNWGEVDFLIIDLPPGTGDVQMTMIEQLPIHGGVVVSTPQSVALLDAHKGLTMFEKMKVPVLGVVENMSHFTCPSCGHEEAIFGDGVEDFSEQRQVPIIAKIPLLSKIRERADSGKPIALDEDGVAKHYQSLAEVVIERSIQ